MDHRKKNVTSADVAKKAGVSRATVSYILNNRRDSRVAEATRSRVMEAAESLGYQPDIHARAMKTGCSMAIGIVSRRSVTESRFTRVLHGVREQFHARGYTLTLCSDEISSGGKPEYLRLFLEKRLDGVIFLSRLEDETAAEMETRLHWITDARLPCVFSDFHMQAGGFPKVDIDYAQGAYTAIRHLLKKGHRNIGLFIPTSDNPQEEQRRKGAEQAVAEIPDARLILYTFRPGKDDLGAALRSVLMGRSGFTALAGAWIYHSAHILQLGAQMGIRIPDELAVISLADDHYIHILQPRLSCVNLPLYELGHESAGKLLELMEGREAGEDRKLPCSLCLLDSC
ncbi:MAG TPA: hypothetical protein DD727_02995 [Clostridiales bacterium]|nr:hypothetical protein [Clostridiales bacterium]